ncbi:cyclic GMP-AMP synthase-like receptor [Schistocerca cancellata]|uniref:cyclic GMP-AMP synthase-like receptor n=1 Tax=Schistocerca cancellata TaxID=274614 RepID=UPI00211810CA|nr:cyclic GMP-AMP synthase-like receptor [Schistocerca cancellata]
MLGGWPRSPDIFGGNSLAESDLMRSRSSLGRANALLEYINKHYVSLNDDDMKKYGAEFRTVLDCIIQKMKEKDKKFNECYQRIFFAGSYWDGLKVGKPTEFDVDIVIKLPFIRNLIQVEPCESPAFVKVKVGTRQPNFRKQKSQKKKPPKQPPKEPSNQPNFGKMLLESLLDYRRYLTQSPLRTWMESVLHQALGCFPQEGDSWVLYDEKQPGRQYMVKVKKSGPALTLNIVLLDGFRMDVDLVPVIELRCCEHLPSHFKLQQYSDRHNTFFIVPKPNKRLPKADDCWRLAFHEQERAVLATYGAGMMKPVCRLLKKLRDTLDMPMLASYYLKTLVMKVISEQEDDRFFRNSLVNLFVHMLVVLKHQLGLGCINYFWDENYNLLEGYHREAVRHCYGRIKNVVEDIQKNIEMDPLVLARNILNDEEFRSLPLDIVEYA